ncbi:trypsin-like peptidase domain-containing protein [Candidatus Parcubacteria bacterium]|nr:trypsin-like peptidase domain-containing protein [Candidatus Parcubacteria bacterium]
MPKGKQSKIIFEGGEALGIGWWYEDHISFSAPSSSGYIQVINQNGEVSNEFEITVACSNNSYSCGVWSSCSSSGTQTRICDKINNCEDSDLSPATTQFCTPSCTSDDWFCTDWDSCLLDGTQYRDCNKTTDCQGGVSSPVASQSCDYIPSCVLSDWSCTNWDTCSSSGTQTRICNKISNCEGGTQSPATTQSCTYTPTCTEDTWQCGNWNIYSPQGIQTRSCNKTYDCSSAETASPATSQYCQTPNQSEPQTLSDDLEIVNQSSIIKATVKLLCPVSATMASQGSGTIIDSDGTILTNKHVVDGTAGCLVGFIDNYNDEPYFADRHIADIYKVSSDADVAILKLRNPYSRNLTAINIAGSNSNNLSLGDQITTYGYPGKFGTKITYTSGDFSGVDGNYLKTTAIIEYGNSGGGAYLKNGTFIGIPSAVMKGDLNSMGYILSVNKINSWLNGSPMAYNNDGDNNYARVSILEDIDLNTLDSLDLFIFSEDENNNDNVDNSNNQNNSNSQNIIAEEKNLITKIDNNLSNRMSGNILLQVEKNGEGWYVNPDNEKKYYLGRPADAFSIMRKLGLGATHEFITNNAIFPDHVLGKILLDVEQNGEAYYIYPKDKKAYYLGRPADAFKIMRELGLGITNSDIRKIDVGDI